MAETAKKTKRERTSRLWLGFGGLLVAVLLGGVFTLGSLNAPFAPDTRTEFLVLFALSTFNIAALFIFGLILVRSLFRLWAERRAEQLGARFKTKMVLGAMGISVLPLVFMFFISYALMNRTLNKWFPRPLEIAARASRDLIGQLRDADLRTLQQIGISATPHLDKKSGRRWSTEDLPACSAVAFGADAAWTLTREGKVAAGFSRKGNRPLDPSDPNQCLTGSPQAPYFEPVFNKAFVNGAEIWLGEGDEFLAVRVPLAPEGTLLVGRRLPASFWAQYAEVDRQLAAYSSQGQELRTFKNQILLTLGLFTVLLMFSATWFALFLAKQVTQPIAALAAGTQEVSRGNLGYQVNVEARDELGALVKSFNEMTQQLADSRRQVDEFTRSLQQALTEIEERRKLMETILENIPTAVLSLDATGTITRANQVVERMFGAGARGRRTLAELMGAEAARGVENLMRKALRMGSATEEFEIELPAAAGATAGPGAGAVLQTAVTVSALGPRRSNPGFVVVIDDLTDLLRAQKAAAWQSVAQRIAHEIKNPLTPIQLSAQRLVKYLNGGVDAKQGAQALPPAPPASGQAGAAVPRELSALVRECAGLIEREVGTLKALVDEFSQFARFPTARPAPVELNALVAGALEVFAGRLDGIAVRTELGANLPEIKADAELLRRVLVNLIDNAAEAMEGSAARELRIATRAGGEGESVEIVVADSGHGISPEDKGKLFLPHFSTRGRGTGLGLAIAARIVAEHGGTIRAEDHSPVGARLVIRLPVAEVVKESV